MFITTDEWEVRIYPFIDEQPKGSEGHISIDKHGTAGRMTVNMVLKNISREQWDTLSAAADTAFKIMESGVIPAAPPPSR